MIRIAHLSRTALSALLLLSLITPSIFAGNDFNDETSRDEWTQRREARYQIGVRGAYRVDDREYNDYTVSNGLRLLYYPADWMALVVGFTYNSHSELNTRTSVRTLVVDMTWRLQTTGHPLSPFLEVGTVAPRYWARINGRKVSESKPGLRLAAGLTFGLGAQLALDLSASQIINHAGVTDYVLTTDPAPCPPGVDCGFDDIPDGAYNEANIELMLRFGL